MVLGTQKLLWADTGCTEAAGLYLPHVTKYQHVTDPWYAGVCTLGY